MHERVCMNNACMAGKILFILLLTCFAAKIQSSGSLKYIYRQNRSYTKFVYEKCTALLSLNGVSLRMDRIAVLR